MMTRLRGLCAALTLCGLLTIASSAAAECAWVLWASPNDAAGVAFPEKAAPVQSFLTKEFCERARKAAEETKSGSTYWVFCLPDTIHPRSPKGR
jgi:hypothetical protein